MKNHMHLTLNKPSQSPLDHFIRVINEMIDRVNASQQTVRDKISQCRELRTARKHFEKNLKTNFSKFDSLSEIKQMEMELHFYNILKGLDAKVPHILEALKEKKGLLSRFLHREVRKSYKIVKSTQKKMAEKVYTNNAAKVLNDPEKYQKLVDAWGDLADDEY